MYVLGDKRKLGFHFDEVSRKWVPTLACSNSFTKEVPCRIRNFLSRIREIKMMALFLHIFFSNYPSGKWCSGHSPAASSPSPHLLVVSRPTPPSISSVRRMDGNKRVLSLRTTGHSEARPLFSFEGFWILTTS
jgi:hypothetical protein